MCGALVLFAMLGITAVIAFNIGEVVGDSRADLRRARTQRDSIRRYLNDHSDKYSAVTVHEESSGYAFMQGTVSSSEDFRLLESEMQRLFGEELAHEMTRRIDMVPVSSNRIAPKN